VHVVGCACFGRAGSACHGPALHARALSTLCPRARAAGGRMLAWPNQAPPA